MQALSPNGKILISIDGEEGHGLIINFLKKVVVARFNFRGAPSAVSFSPDSKFFAVAVGTKLKIFESPNVSEKIFSPLSTFNL